MSKEIKKPFYKKWWFILIVVLFIVGVIGNALESDKTEETKNSKEEIVESTVKEVSFNSNEGIKNYLEEKSKALNILEVNGSYAGDGNSTVVITLDAEDNGMKFAINQVVMTVKELNEADLSDFSNVGISVKADMTDGEKGFAIKSDFDPKTINSDKAKSFRNKNIADNATSWWQLED